MRVRAKVGVRGIGLATAAAWMEPTERRNSGDTGRSREIRGDLGRCREIQGDIGRYNEEAHRLLLLEAAHRLEI